MRKARECRMAITLTGCPAGAPSTSKALFRKYMVFDYNFSI